MNDTIIDTHIHMMKEGHKETKSVEYTLNEMDKNGIEKAVLLPIEPYASLDGVVTAVEQYSDRFIPFCIVDPKSSKAFEELEKHLGKEEFYGVKLHPRFQSFRPDDPQVGKFVDKIADYGVPVLVDSLLHGPTLIEDNLPLKFDHLARNAPNTTIIMAHFGGYRFMDALFVARVNHNVFVDLSIIGSYFLNSSFEGQLKFAMEKLGSDRILYGSDFPFNEISSELHACKELCKDIFSEQQTNDILGNNIRKMLSL